MISVFAVLGAAQCQSKLLQALRQLLLTSQVVHLHRAGLPSAGACLCCQLHNETSDVLRELFMQALQKKIAPFSAALIDCAPTVDVSSVRYTMGQDFFLKARYQWQGAFLAIDRDFVQQLFQHAGMMSPHKNEYQQEKKRLYELLSQEDFAIDMSRLLRFLPYFAASDVGVYTQDAFEDKQEQHIFELVLQQIYTHLQIFQPDIPLLRLLCLRDLNADVLLTLQQQWQQAPAKTKRHLFTL